MEETKVAVLVDSGARREFESGAVRDICEGKGRCDLLPLDVVADLLANNIMVWLDQCRYYLENQNENIALDYARKIFTQFTYVAFGDTYTAVLELAKHFESGAVKYGDNNWRKGIPAHCYIDSAVRHYLKYMRGDKDEPHDRAFLWNLVCCIWEVKNHGWS